MNREQIREHQRSLIHEFVAAQDYEGKRVLDFGCNIFPYRQAIEAKGGAWTGFNRPFPGGGAEIVGPDDPLASGWDMILCTQVLQYVPEPYETLHEFRQALRKAKGTLVLTYATNWPETDPGDLWRFTMRGMQELLTDWQIVQHDPLGANAWTDDEVAVMGYGVVARA